MRALPCQQKLGVQLLKKDGGESIIQITVIHLHLQSRWCRVSASAGPEEDGFHVDLWDRSQAPSLEPTGHLMRFPMIYVALCTENIIRGTHIGLLLINFTLILPLDTFQYNIDNPDEQKLLALHGGKLKFPQLKHIEPSLRCFGKMSFLSPPPPLLLVCVPTWKGLAPNEHHAANPGSRRFHLLPTALSWIIRSRCRLSDSAFIKHTHPQPCTHSIVVFALHSGGGVVAWSPVSCGGVCQSDLQWCWWQQWKCVKITVYLKY